MIKEIDKMFVVYGEEQGEIKDFKTLEEAKRFIQELKKTDIEEGIQDNYYIEKEEK